MVEPLLAAHDLRVRHRIRRGRRNTSLTALDQVNLELTPGQITALAGESGSGKTTLARTLLGLRTPDTGRILYHGQPLPTGGRALRSHRRHIQLIPQDPTSALNPRHTVYEAVAEGPRIHKLDGHEPNRVAQALADAGLRPPTRYLDAYPHELSGGQRQRVVIAGALALNPSILIADEPTASLDACARGDILRLLLRLRDRHHLAALVITHDLGVAWSVADHVAIMYLGRIIEAGPAEQVLTSPATSQPRRTPDAAAIPPGCRFHPRCPLLAAGLPPDAERQCRTHDPGPLPAAGPHTAACHHTQPHLHR